METFSIEKSVTWDGGLPENGWRGLLDSGFVPIECKAGDLLTLSGQLDHLSLPNGSNRARHTFQLHLVEGTGAGVTWSPSNWLQYPQGEPFLSLLGS
jgi:phytanoyl-CoA hydroxylase